MIGKQDNLSTIGFVPPPLFRHDAATGGQRGHDANRLRDPGHPAHPHPQVPLSPGAQRGLPPPVHQPHCRLPWPAVPQQPDCRHQPQRQAGPPGGGGAAAPVPGLYLIPAAQTEVEETPVVSEAMRTDGETLLFFFFFPR